MNPTYFSASKTLMECATCGLQMGKKALLQEAHNRWHAAQAERFVTETKAAALREAAAVWEDEGYFDPLGDETPAWLKRRADAIERGETA